MEYIVLFLFGVLIGNFTTTVFHRLPRKIILSGSTQPPFCSNCGHLLFVYEYLPILSWFSTFGKCNYCHTPITKYYLILELTVGLLAVILHFLLGHNIEYFFLYFCLATLITLNIVIYLEHHFISRAITVGITITGMIFRTLSDHEIITWLASLSLVFVTGLCIIKIYRFNQSFHHILMHVILPASLWCQGYTLLILLFMLFVFYILNMFIEKTLYPFSLINIFLISLWFNV